MATLASARRQFQDVFSEVIVYTASFNPANAATGLGTFASTDITIPGAALGDFVMVSHQLDPVDCFVCGAVTAANTVTVTVLNNTAAGVDLGAATLRLVVLKANPGVFFL
jgi:hypothetical protein